MADFVAVGEQGERPTRPPTDVVADILALPNADAPFPRLAGIANSPIFIPCGRLLLDNGYDADSGLYLNHKGLAPQPDMKLTTALHLLLDDLLVDFPFADDAGRAHGLALLVEPFMRPMICGSTPLYLIDAPTPGTGKGLLADVTAMVALGRSAPVMALSSDEYGVEKRITSILLKGYPLVLLDNVRALRSRALSAALTATIWQGRLLGQSEMVQVPNNATWLATANNPNLSDELARRVVPIRLDAGMEHPEERNGFKHAKLLEWAEGHRSELVSACLSIIQAWVEVGMPPGRATLGSYEAWAANIGGILEVVGVLGFLANRQSTRGTADRETREWVAFCTLWWEGFHERPVTAGDLFEVAKEHKVLLDLWAGRSELAAQQCLGHALAARRDRVCGEYAIRLAG